MFNHRVFCAVGKHSSGSVCLIAAVLGHGYIVTRFVFEIKAITIYNTSAMTTFSAYSANILSLIVALLAIGLSAYGLILAFKFNKLKNLFLKGKDGQDLEAAIKSLIDGMRSLDRQNQSSAADIEQLRRQLNLATQKIGLVRFNPFDDGGGNFSFSLALLDAHKNGVVVTSMHGRQQNRIYSKKIIGGQGEHQLTGEEQEAINQANI